MSACWKSKRSYFAFWCRFGWSRKLAYEYHDNTKITDKNGKEKKLRSDANILLAGVVSLNKDNKDIWEDYKNDAIAYLSNKYGKS